MFHEKGGGLGGLYDVNEGELSEYEASDGEDDGDKMEDIEFVN